MILCTSQMLRNRAVLMKVCTVRVLSILICCHRGSTVICIATGSYWKALDICVLGCRVDHIITFFKVFLEHTLAIVLTLDM